MASLVIEPRAGWNALPARDDDTLAPSSRRGVVVHWNGPKMPQPDHAGCDELVRSIQRYHMLVKKWTDGAYSYVVCQHGTVYEMRGRTGYQFANGSLDPDRGGTGDYSLRPSEAWYTVMCLTGGDHDAAGRLVDEQKPSAAMLRSLGLLVALLRSWGAGDETKPHRAFRIKTCPGDALAAWCARHDGRPITQTGEDDMSAEDVKAINAHTDAVAERLADELYKRVARAEFGGKVIPTHYPVSLHAIRAQLNEVGGKVDAVSAIRLAVDALGDDEEQARADLLAVEQRLLARIDATHPGQQPAG